MDHPDYANTQAYLQELYNVANRSRLARGASVDSMDARPGLLARLRRGGNLVFHRGGSGRLQDRFEDDTLTLTLHVG